jgi:hypothetical protein
MGQVSEAGEKTLVSLIGWEMFGDQEVDPKLLIRQISTADLTSIYENLGSIGKENGSAIERMLVLEHFYRQGWLGDWSCTRQNLIVTVGMVLKQPVEYVQMTFTV